MPITADDIVLLESERLTDAYNAGGRQTTHVVPDNVAGNVFPKVSRLDATYGRVNLRKLYLAVRTALTEMYSGAHVIVSEPPTDPLVQPLLFSTGSSFDTRADVQNRIESYVVAGPESSYVLYGTQVSEQMSIKVYARESAPLPDIGDVLCLSIESGADAGNQQYVRITDVEHGVAEFEDSRGVFYRRVITLGISARLVRDYPAGPVVRESAHGNATLVRETVIADAARYFGTQRLTQPATARDLSVYVSSVYGQVVPSTRREAPVVSAMIAGVQTFVAAAATDTQENLGTAYTASGDYVRYFGGPVMPGSVRLIRTANGDVVYQDDGRGNLISTTPTYFQDGTVDYLAGRVAFRKLSNTFSGDQVRSWVYRRAAQVEHPSHTRDIAITPATRGTVYAETLLPIPAPGTLILDYRALGRWYRLRDDGTGNVVGADPSLGNGSIDYTTGALVVTLGALPDIGSAVLLAWGSPAHYEILTPSPTVTYSGTLGERAVEPESITWAWTSGGVARTATDDGSGAITGHAGGNVDYWSATYTLDLATYPIDPDTDLYVTWTPYQDGAVEDHDDDISSGTFDIGEAIRPYSLIVSLRLHMPDGSYTVPVSASDDGIGNLRISGTGRRSLGLASGTGTYSIDAGTIVGSVVYATGVVTLAPSASVRQQVWQAPSWTVLSRTATVVGVSVTAYSRAAVALTPETETSQSITIGNPADGGLHLSLEPSTEYLVPGSIMFSYRGKKYVDRAGTLYADIDPATGSGTPAGTIDYATRDIGLYYYNPATTGALTLLAGLKVFGDWTATDVQFRTPGSPIRPASLYVQANRPDGTLITGTADINGEISGAYMRGEVQQDMGVVHVEFGEYVESEWTPLEVMPSTIRYHCVVLADLPLSADILGLDPVRLPSDGRVPIYRPADVLVIHHTAQDALPDPAVAGATYVLSRGALDYVEIVDQDGDRVDRDLYTVDLDEGEVTMADPIDLSGYEQPLIVRHRIEDMALASDVQITGEVTLSAALTHDYPADETLVSSALVAGDLYAHVSHLFDQTTWTGVWQDTPAGTAATANYDDVNYPIEVSNEGCVTERWRIHFTSATAFSLYGENLGLIATGNTSTNLSPVNPLTGLPYFTLLAAGWGGGWATGNQLRINTRGANYPIWISRSILAGASRAGDRFDLAIRGDTDDE